MSVHEGKPAAVVGFMAWFALFSAASIRSLPCFGRLNRSLHEWHAVSCSKVVVMVMVMVLVLARILHDSREMQREIQRCRVLSAFLLSGLAGSRCIGLALGVDSGGGVDDVAILLFFLEEGLGICHDGHDPSNAR